MFSDILSKSENGFGRLRFGQNLAAAIYYVASSIDCITLYLVRRIPL